MLRPTVVLAAAAAAAALIVAVPALAGGAGSTTTTEHAHGTDVSLVGVIAGDDWFTTTFTGQVDAYDGTVVDEEGDVAPVGDVLYSGHLTTWFGSEDNKQNGVFHATLDFHGTSSTDPSQTIRLHGSFDVTFNANGEATATPANATCTT